MHELGVITHLAKTLNDVAQEQNIQSIHSVTLQIGEVSGIMTDYFVDCWNWFKKKYPPLVDSELILETIHAVTFCDDCQKTYETVKYGKTCPYCHSENTYLVTGDETIIKQIEVLTEDDDLDGKNIEV